MEVIVEGEDLTPEMFSEDLGWQAAVARRSSNKATVARSFEIKMEGFAPKAGGSARERQNGDIVKRKVIKAARMPPLPKEDAKIILRPRGGLDVSRVGVTAVGRAIMKASGIDEANANSNIICANLLQNIVVVSTPDRENASRYTRIKTIEVASEIHEVNAYEAAPHSTCKGVIKCITLSDGAVDLERNIVNARNPLALGEKRIKKTGTVIVPFDGFKVPNFVRYGPVLVRCFLYRKQVDNCYACGKLGHPADLCPSSKDVVRRGCGSSNTDDHHQCTQKCQFCGGPHITADKICRQRYQIPYVVRRRWEKAAEAFGSKDGDDMARHPLTQECRGRSKRRSRSKGRSHSRGRSRTRAGYRSWSRGRSRSKGSSHNTAGSRSRFRGRCGSRRREGEVRFETRRSRSGIANTGSSHHGPTESVKVQRKSIIPITPLWTCATFEGTHNHHHVAAGCGASKARRQQAVVTGSADRPCLAGRFLGSRVARIRSTEPLVSDLTSRDMAHFRETHENHSMIEGAPCECCSNARHRAGVKRILSELEEIEAEPPNQCTAGLIDPENPYSWHASIAGPEGSPYEGGLFNLRIQLPRDYPLGAPVVNFLTTIYHPNISTTTGAVCLDLLKWKWTPTLSVRKVLASIRSLMCNPNLDMPLEFGVAAEYKNNREQYTANAKLWTMAFAKE
ncbi:hypothetical protein HPB52_008480 [Rhipicephalus sanguineus]|uniref:E2 ubiquitin-conjugating enzyme n=1 Tax=Rhipicephalus sanguineus TaxID=34632 RepID=A0A9D4PJW1_RHISA|nr:hypothetical protein HPB52_008480 [Rhipicephalus sanguineus]